MELKLLISILLFVQSWFSLNFEHINKKELLEKEPIYKCIEFKKNCEFTIDQDKHTKRCEKWNLNQVQLDLIFKHIESFDFNSYDYIFNRMPCWVEGTALFKGDTVEFQVNSGGGIIVTNKDSVFYFGCRSKICRPFFIIESNTDK
jgi:hypothetical protein